MRRPLNPVISWLLLALISFSLGYGAIELYRALFPAELTGSQTQEAPSILPAQ